MKKILEGSRAIAETIKNIGIDVVSAYPITPQTHIIEDLAKFKADGEADYEYIIAESEFAALSALIGASTTGARTYTATSSQGLLLMTEVLYNVAGMRLPIVMTDANRAVSAPINIWNDQQDAVTMRDAGWIMFYGENNQEVCDLHILAYKIAEICQIPIMINLDGFILTHTLEPVEIVEPKLIKKFLPAFRLNEKLDPKNPLTFGAFATPTHYMEIRQELHNDIISSKKLIAKEMIFFKKCFGRKLSLIDYYGDKFADTVIVAMGSILGTIKDAVDEFEKTGKKVGVLKVSSFRPFPAEEIIKKIGDKKNILVIDKSISLGGDGILAGELKRCLYGKSRANILSVIMGLGGRDITKEMIKKALKQTLTLKNNSIFIGK